MCVIKIRFGGVRMVVMDARKGGSNGKRWQ